jgi:hypothetical protein
MKDLEGIARQAMIDRGLLPDFSPAALCVRMTPIAPSN